MSFLGRLTYATHQDNTNGPDCFVGAAHLPAGSAVAHWTEVHADVFTIEKGQRSNAAIGEQARAGAKAGQLWSVDQGIGIKPVDVKAGRGLYYAAEEIFGLALAVRWSSSADSLHPLQLRLASKNLHLAAYFEAFPWVTPRPPPARCSLRNRAHDRCRTRGGPSPWKNHPGGSGCGRCRSRSKGGFSRGGIGKSGNWAAH